MIGLVVLFCTITCSLSQFMSPIYPPTSMVLTTTVDIYGVNCEMTCSGLGLRCMHDSMPLKTFDQYFVREWFWIIGAGKSCNRTTYANWEASARATTWYPSFTAFINVGDTIYCYGWAAPTTAADASTCKATTKPLYERSLCYCSDTGQQAKRHAKHWTQLTSSYVKAMQYANSSLYTWDNAKALCQGNYTATLPYVSSQQENDELLAFARSKFGFTGMIWLNFLGNTRLDTAEHMPAYQNWDISSSVPTTSGTNDNAAALNLATGRWVYLPRTTTTNVAFVVCRLLDFYRWTSKPIPEPPQLIQRPSTKINPSLNYFSENVTSSMYDCINFCSKNIQCMSATFQTSTSKCRQYPYYTSAHTGITINDTDYTLFDRVLSKNLL